MVPSLGFRHGKGNTLIIRKGHLSCIVSFFLDIHAFPNTIYWSMGSVDVRYEKVKTSFIPVENAEVYLLPFLLDRPFTIMVKDCIPCWTLTTEKMTYRQKALLASALNLVEYGVDL